MKRSGLRMSGESVQHGRSIPISIYTYLVFLYGPMRHVPKQNRTQRKSNTSAWSDCAYWWALRGCWVELLDRWNRGQASHFDQILVIREASWSIEHRSWTSRKANDINFMSLSRLRWDLIFLQTSAGLRINWSFDSHARGIDFSHSSPLRQSTPEKKAWKWIHNEK